MPHATGSTLMVLAPGTSNADRTHDAASDGAAPPLVRPATPAVRISFPARCAVAMLGAYKRFISPLLPPLCRFYPSCSSYAAEAIARHGIARGLLMSFVRLSKCHPLHPGGFDPVK